MNFNPGHMHLGLKSERPVVNSAIRSPWIDSEATRCSVIGCQKKALWEDALRGEPINGRKWCTEHAMCYRSIDTLVPWLELKGRNHEDTATAL